MKYEDLCHLAKLRSRDILLNAPRYTDGCTGTNTLIPDVVEFRWQYSTYDSEVAVIP